MTAWEEIVRDHGPATYRTAWRILGHAQDCEDVVQEVFLAAHKHFARKEITHWRTFLNRLVTYRALDSLRRRKPTVPLESATIQDSSQTPERHLMELEEASYVRSMIARLPDRQAAVFCLAHLEGHSIQEIASILQVSPNAVSIALHKGRANLRNQVAIQTTEQD